VTAKYLEIMQSLKILSVMAAIRLDGKPDNIEKVLFSSLMGENFSKDRNNMFLEWIPMLQTLGKR
jgi:hypothetical protein